MRVAGPSIGREPHPRWQLGNQLQPLMDGHLPKQDLSSPNNATRIIINQGKMALKLGAPLDVIVLTRPQGHI